MSGDVRHLRESSWNSTCMNAQDSRSSGAASAALLAQKSASAALSLLITACSKLPDCSTRALSVITCAQNPAQLLGPDVCTPVIVWSEHIRVLT